MDIEYLNRWVTNQLSSGIPKEEIGKNVLNYTKLNREEAEHFVNDPLYREEYKLSSNKTPEIEQNFTDENIITILSGIETQLEEI